MHKIFVKHILVKHVNMKLKKKRPGDAHEIYSCETYSCKTCEYESEEKRDLAMHVKAPSSRSVTRHNLQILNHNCENLWW